MAAMTSTSRLRLALRDLDAAVGRPSAPTLAGLAAGFGRRLSRSTLSRLRVENSARVPTWQTLETFVKACLLHASATSCAVPGPLDDLLYWRRLHDECSGRRTAEVHNIASGHAGSVVQARDIHGSVHVHPPRRKPAVRSAYLEQVARIAPDELFDRADELSELADWCTGDHDATYMWWQAPAWAGKSALMSWFVLHPPPDVRVVSFFITARLSSQNDKTAFAEVVLEQLAETLEQPLPELLTDATRDAHLLGLLAEAATFCRERDQRLVLVVDGLDEDRGVTVGADAHSIAALLPAPLAGGMRVVVTGRPDPPIPEDVADRHPLRDKNIVRLLSRSEHAEVVRVDAQRELIHLLRGTPAERDLLGLVAAAGGGLSSQDLADLTGWSMWEIEEHLRAVSGRTFTRREVGWGPSTAPPVYLLAHEQLQQDAIRMLGEAQLARYRQRVHEWAGQYRELGWPIRTPEYLLRGYFRLLRETGETARLVDCALDRSRHERMLDLTGGDSAALTEIATTHDVLDGQDRPDLLSMVRLAIYRAELNDRNYFIPTGLPEAWARLGHYSRAEALAWSLPDPEQQTRALTAVARTAAAAGDTERASRILSTITTPPVQGDLAATTRSVNRTEQYLPKGRYASHVLKRHLKPTVEQVRVAIADGKLAHAEALAARIPTGVQRWRAVRELVRAVSRLGDISKAEQLARTIASPRWQAKALTDLVVLIADTGDVRRAENLAAEAERSARIGHPLARQPEVVIEVVRALAVAGDPARAEKLARTITDTRWQGRALAELACSMPSGAETVAATITDSFWRARATVSIFQAAAAAGDTARAARLFAAAKSAAGAVAGSREQAEVWAGLAVGMAVLGEFDGAESLARAIDNEGWREQALTDLVAVLARAGHLDRAAALVEAVTNDDRRAQALIAVATATARAGEISMAEAVAGRIADPRWRTRALTELAAAGGVHAARFAAEAEAASTGITFTAQKAMAAAEVVAAHAAAGDIARAEAVARGIAVPRWRVRALSRLASIVDADRARELAQTIGDPDAQARALAALAARSTGPAASRLIAAVLRMHMWTATLDPLARVSPEVVRAIGDDFLG